MNVRFSCKDCDTMHSPHLPVTLSILPFVAQPCTISPFHLLSCFQSSSVFMDLNLSPLLGFLPATISMADFNLFSISVATRACSGGGC